MLARVLLVMIVLGAGACSGTNHRVERIPEGEAEGDSTLAEDPRPAPPDTLAANDAFPSLGVPRK